MEIVNSSFTQILNKTWCIKATVNIPVYFLNEKKVVLFDSGYKDERTRPYLDEIISKNPKALLADKLFIRRVCDYIGQYFVRLGGADLIIFSAGIGENSPEFRQKVIDEIAPALGVEIDRELNKGLRGKEALLSTPTSKIKVALIPTDEEVMLARDAYKAYLEQHK